MDAPKTAAQTSESSSAEGADHGFSRMCCCCCAFRSKSTIPENENSTLDEQLLKPDNVKIVLIEEEPPLYDSLNPIEDENYYSCVAGEGVVGQYGSLPPNTSLTPMNSAYSRHYEMSSAASSKPLASCRQVRKRNQDPHTNPRSQNGVPPHLQVPVGYSSLYDVPYESAHSAAGEGSAQVAQATNMSYEFDERFPAARTSAMIGQVSQVYSKDVPTEVNGEVYSYAVVGKIEANIKGNSNHGDYHHPAGDEKSLYAQFSALNMNLIKKEDIRLGDFLGSGQFGKVYKGEWSTGGQKVPVAIKTLHTNSRDSDKVRFLQEAAIMGQFRHLNVIKMYGIATESEPFMIVLELLALGDLRQHLISMRPQGGVDSELPPLLLKCCRDIAFGMCYLSKIGFVHRDLAARNVLVCEDRTCKVADFGMSRDLANEDYYISHGGHIPVKWTAPEAVNYKKYSTASDIWSYGVVMYEIWSLGHKPFENYSNTEAFKLMCKGIRLAPPPGCPRTIYGFMIKCWHPVSSDRPAFQDVVKFLFMKEDVLLKWSVKDKAVHLSACLLGADLEVAENLHKDLRKLYCT